jgi:nucleotide-binding universal stress UspA family protein
MKTFATPTGEEPTRLPFHGERTSPIAQFEPARRAGEPSGRAAVGVESGGPHLSRLRTFLSDMVSRVLVAMDDSEMAANALRYALDVHPEADVTVLTVVGEPSGTMGRATAIATADDPETKASELAEPVFERARELAAGRGREVETVVALGHPARRIVERAAEFDAVVLGSHGGTTADRLFVGNVAETVFKRASVPVTVVR